ncbi:MAG: class I SAM-dependent rRNA methyltransferase [Bradymonadaceae bacterium]
MRHYPSVTLTQPLENTLRLGHPWIFADAVRHDPSLKDGDVVDVLGAGDEWIGRGLIEPGSPLRVRVFTRNPRVDVDHRLLEARIKAALKRRPFPNAETTGFRLLNGEGDLVPGLVCDVYGSCAVLRPDGKAAERWLKPARRVISKLLPIKYWAIRRSEIHRGSHPKAMWWDEGPASNDVEFLEEGIHFVCDPIEGQKTGFFLDQRANRRHIAGLSAGKRVLNLFGYTGGFSVAAARAGAARTTTVDIAGPALEVAKRHFRMNQLAPEAHEFTASDVFAYLEGFDPRSAPFEVVICDPPSFAHKRQDLEGARAAYERLFSRVFEIMPEGATVALASCSSHIDRPKFMAIIAASAAQARCDYVLGGVWGADVDHPTLAAFPEGDYLQFAVGTVGR